MPDTVAVNLLFHSNSWIFCCCSNCWPRGVVVNVERCCSDQCRRAFGAVLGGHCDEPGTTPQPLVKSEIYPDSFPWFPWRHSFQSCWASRESQFWSAKDVCKTTLRGSLRMHVPADRKGTTVVFPINCKPRKDPKAACVTEVDKEALSPGSLPNQSLNSGTPPSTSSAVEDIHRVCVKRIHRLADCRGTVQLDTCCDRVVDSSRKHLTKHNRHVIFVLLRGFRDERNFICISLDRTVQTPRAYGMRLFLPGHSNDTWLEQCGPHR